MNATTDIQKFLQLILRTCEREQVSMLSGSSFEMPIWYTIEHFSDFDALFFDKNTFAFEKHRPARNTSAVNNRKKLILLEIDSVGTHPGFVRLKDSTGKFFKHYTSSEIFPKDGPSSKVSSSDRIMQAFLNRTEDFNIDYVDAVFCATWPSGAEEWITRKRRHGWPTDELINKVVQGGFHLVGKPHPYNQDSKYEWRFSFSKAELILITNWNENQLYIFQILKFIKNDLIERCCGKTQSLLSTYHFKTLMLWACEEKSENFWDDENIVASVQELMIDMIEWLVEKRCPNYFVRNNNMLDFISSEEDFQLEIEFLLERVLNGYVSKLVSKEPKACTDCKFDLIFENSSLLHIFFGFYHYNDNYFPEDQNISAEIKSRKMTLLRRDVTDTFNAIKLHAALMRSKNSSTVELIKQASLAFEKATKKQDLGTSRIRFSANSGIAFLRGMGICSNYLEQNSDINDYDSSVSVTCHKKCNISQFQQTMEFHFMQILRLTNKGCSGPSLSYGLAFAANFYYVNGLDYRNAIRLCELGMNLENTWYGGDRFPFPFASDFAILFDKCMQTMLGFLLIYARTVQPYNRSLRVCMKMSVFIFFLYIRLQCVRMESSCWKDVLKEVETLKKFQLGRTSKDDDSKLFDYSVIMACLRVSGIHAQ